MPLRCTRSLTLFHKGKPPKCIRPNSVLHTVFEHYDFPIASRQVQHSNKKTNQKNRLFLVVEINKTGWSPQKELKFRRNSNTQGKPVSSWFYYEGLYTYSAIIQRLCYMYQYVMMNVWPLFTISHRVSRFSAHSSHTQETDSVGLTVLV